jgi:hypothetical protein
MKKSVRLVFSTWLEGVRYRLVYRKVIALDYESNDSLLLTSFNDSFGDLPRVEFLDRDIKPFLGPFNEVDNRRFQVVWATNLLRTYVKLDVADFDSHNLLLSV